MTRHLAKLEPGTAVSALLGLIIKVQSQARVRGILYTYNKVHSSSLVGQVYQRSPHWLCTTNVNQEPQASGRTCVGVRMWKTLIPEGDHFPDKPASYFTRIHHSPPTRKRSNTFCMHVTVWYIATTLSRLKFKRKTPTHRRKKWIARFLQDLIPTYRWISSSARRLADQNMYSLVRSMSCSDRRKDDNLPEINSVARKSSPHPQRDLKLTSFFLLIRRHELSREKEWKKKKTTGHQAQETWKTEKTLERRLSTSGLNTEENRFFFSENPGRIRLRKLRQWKV